MTAHVDSGKTTLSEAMLYQNGEIRSLGRVDKRNTFLDTHSIERNRGITVFAKQAVMHIGKNDEYTLLDTPGHVDFSAETERAMQVLDYAILVISGLDGVQSHTETLWNLLKRYKVPVFVFVNKMDISHLSCDYILNDLRNRLSVKIVDFSPKKSRNELCENLALCTESLMDSFLENGDISDESIASAIAERDVFPCFFGSALKLEGITEFLEGLRKYTVSPEYSDEFGARVYKITLENNVRLTHMKITGGSLKVKSSLICGKNGETTEEKVNQIRIYSGAKFIPEEEVSAGSICAVAGLSKTFAGE